MALNSENKKTLIDSAKLHDRELISSLSISRPTKRITIPGVA
jgi:hypothetical protein